jgi:hypothetical protein
MPKVLNARRDTRAATSPSSVNSENSYILKVKNTFLDVSEDEPCYPARRSSSAHAVLQHAIFTTQRRHYSANSMPAAGREPAQPVDRPMPKQVPRTMQVGPEISNVPSLGYNTPSLDAFHRPAINIKLPYESTFSQSMLSEIGNLSYAMNDQIAAASPIHQQESSQHSSGDSDDMQTMSEESWDASQTTVMIRGIPCGFTQEQLLDQINQAGFEGKYDFFYLPRAGNSHSNLGYAFVNFTTPALAVACANTLHGVSLDPLRSAKVCRIFPAHIQGYANLKKRFRRTAMRRGERGPLFVSVTPVASPASAA